jgi:hypothetical protein
MPRIGGIDIPDAPRPGLGAIFSSAAQGAYGQLRYGLPYQFEKLAGTADAADEAFYQKGLADTQAASNTATAASVSDLTSGKVGFARFIGENLAQSLPYMVGGVAGGAAGAVVGGVPGAITGAIAGGIPQFSASNVARAVETEGGLSQAAAERSLAVAPFQSAADAAIGRFLPGAGHVLGDVAAHQTGGFLMRTAKSIAEAAGTEAVTEALQQVGERYAAGLDVTNADAAGEYVNAAVTAFGIGGVLGAGGGFRRSNAHAKPVGEVTNDDMVEAINNALTGPPERLALPAPGQGVQVAPGNDVSRPDIVADSRGYAAPTNFDVPGATAAVNAADADVVVDSRGVAAVGTDGVRPTDQLVIDQNLPQQPAPPPPTFADLQATLEAQQPDYGALGATAPTFDPATFQAPQTATSRIALEANANTAPAAPVDVPASPRVFAAQPFDELVTAASAKKAEPALRAEAEKEIANRYAEAQGNAPLTTDDFQTRVDEVKHGLRGSFVTKLTATDAADLRTKVYDEVFEKQNTASSVQKLAQRLGILDENLEPTPAASEIEAARATALQTEAAPTEPAAAVPPAPVVATAADTAPVATDPTFAKQWSQLKSEAGIERERGLAPALKAQPANLEQAQQAVFRELANDTSEAETSQTEKLARKMGLVTDDDFMDITPLGRKTYLSTPEGFEETVNAARDQGYDGALASAFDRGARAAVSGVETSLTGFGDAAAYQAGKVWAERYISTPGVASGATTASIQARQAKRVTATGERPVQRATLAPGQIRQQSLSRLLDAADLRGVSDSDVATLRRMVRQGASAEEVGTALQTVQGGKTLFKQAEAAPVQLSTPQRRGQPIFREMNTPDATPAKADARAQSEVAVRAFDTRNLVEFARAEGGITDARAQKLHDLLDQGKVDQVKRLLKDFDPDADVAPAKRRLPTPPERVDERAPDGRWSGKADEALEADLVGKTFTEALDHMVEVAPSRYHREIMKQVRALAKQIEKTGVALNLRIVKPGDTVPAAFTNPTTRAFAQVLREPPSSTVWLKGTEMGPQNGVNYQIVSHEMLHAVTMLLLQRGETAGVYGQSKLGKAVADLNELGSAVIRHINERARSGAKLSEFEKAVLERDLNALANNHEILAWGMTNPDMQRYLQSIEYQPKQSVFGRLVDLLRGLLGLDGKYETALTELLRVSEQIMGTRGPELNAAYNLGRDTSANVTENVSDLDRVLNSPAVPERVVYGEPQVGTELHPDDAGRAPPKVGLAAGRGMDEREEARYRKAFWRGKEDLISPFPRRDADGFDTAVLEMHIQDADVSQANRTVQAANDVTRDIAARAGQFAESINLADKGVKARRALLGIISHNQMDRQFGDRAPWLLEHSDAHRARTAVRGRWENIGDAAHQQFEVLKREKPQIAKMVNDLMDRATAFQLDPDRAFEDHEHHKNAKNKGALKRIHAELVKVKNDLSRGDGAGIKMFNEFRTLNEAQNYSRLAASLHSLVTMDPELQMGVNQSTTNPMDEFMLQPDIVSSDQLRGWWQQALQRQVAAATAFVNAKKGEVATAAPSEQTALRNHISPIEMMLSSTHEAIAGMAKAPYFHLGRFGDNFGSATIRADANGVVDPKAQEHVAEALAKAGFDDVQISADNTKPKISMRFDTVDQTRRFKQVALELQRQGWLSSDPIHAGPRDRSSNYGVVDGLPSYVSDYIQRIESSPMFVPAENATAADRAALAQQQEEAVRLAVDTWLESQPDSSISKVLAKRYTVAGYQRDMVRNFAHRWTVGSTSLASVSTSPKFNRAFVNARAAINEGLDASTATDPDLQADLFSEVQRRDTRDPFAKPADFSDKLRAASHAYFLGMSPAYGLINMTQLGVVALPELAKQHGYSKSFHAMRRASAVAFQVLKAATAEARSKGAANAADVTLSESVLQKAGLPKNQLDFVRHMLATGSIDIGTSALALGQYAKSGEQTNMQRAARIGLKYAGAIGLYTETFSRLTAALAAHELHGGTTAESAAYATNVVSNSMFDYQNWNTARQLGKQGFAGPITPLLTQFMSYSIQMTEKLYSEAMGAFAKARPGETSETTAARKAESRRFLMGHLVAVTALAGTLGLPFATVFATAIERLVDQFDDDDDPFDATASWRGFLADVLGKDVAEVVSRGLPRALGFDISARAGEQNLLPFSEFLADRRPWKEAVESNAGRSLGAVPSMVSNIVSGGGKIADGDLIGGMKDALPVAFKGPLEAYRLTADGYIDTRGTKLPMTPGASAILWQLIGFSPSERAEYSEARGDQQGRRAEITRQAGTLRNGIVRAMMGGDQDRAKQLIAQAQQFDLDNPAFAVIPSLAGSIKRQQTNMLQARTARAPLGVSMHDVAGRRLTSYANVDYQAGR